MANEKSSSEDAKTLKNDSKDSAPEGSKANAAKSKESKPSVDETRKRAFEVFQARHGEPGSALEDWQKAEASVSADAVKTDASKADAPKADTSKADGSKADASKGVQMPADTGTIPEALAKFHSSIEHGLTQEEAASRLKKDGPNALEERRISPLKRFLTFLWGPIAW